MRYLLALLLMLFPASLIAGDWGLFASTEKPSFDVLSLDHGTAVPLGPDRVVIAYSETCPHCPKAIRSALRGLGEMVVADHSWTFGNTDDRKIQFVDTKEHPALCDALDEEVGGLRLPFAGAIVGNRVVRQWKPGSRPLDQWTLGWLYNGRDERPGGKLSESDMPPDAQPTPEEEIPNILKAAALTSSDVFVDHGCGYDARVLIAATRKHGCRGIGIEIDPRRAASAKQYVADAGLSDKIRIIEGDALTTDVEGTVGFAYLWPDALEQLKPRVKRFKRFVSYSHPIDGLAMRSSGNAFVYEPTQVAVVRRQPLPMPSPTRQVPQQRPVAYYGGRAYSGRVCSSPGCSMCNAISRQLGR